NSKVNQGPGRTGIALVLAQIRTCPIKASGSSRNGFVCRRAIHERYGNRGPRYKALALVPAHGSATRQPFPCPAPATGTAAQQCGERHTDLPMVWTQHDSRGLDEAQIKLRWPACEDVAAA